MMPEEKNRIESLKQSLYSRSAPDIRSRRKFRITNEASDIQRDWEHEKEPIDGSTSDAASAEGHHGMSFFTKLLIYSVVFCLAAVGIGAYIFFNGANFISGNNIEIDISGPVSVPGGAPVSFAITVRNKNTVALKTADLAVRFPPGTTDPTDTTQSLEVYREVLGDIPSGGSVTKTVEAVIFGEQNLQKKIIADVTYGIAGSNSVFTKESSYDVVVNASPVVMSVSSLEEAISGQTFDMNVSIKSNSTNTVKNVIMRATYPFGYVFKSSVPQPLTGDGNVWSIGDIPPGGERKISIKGALTGEDSDLKVFHFNVGARSPSNPTMIGTTFLETEQVLTIEKPFISIAIDIDNDSSIGDHVGNIGRSLTVNLRWANNLPETLSNVEIAAHLAGSAYDKNNVSAWTGYYRSSTNDIVWDQRTNPELASLSAGGSGTLSFSITPSESQGSDTHILNPEITISGSASGDRTSSNKVLLNTGSIVRKVKVVTSASLKGRITRSGPIANTGPIPPVAEQKTTYTVNWSVDNTSNAISEAIVTATLPPQVSWTGQISPSGENISFEKNTGVVTWHVGSVEPFTSGTGTKREVQFQVSLEPSVNQIGTAPILINQAYFTGKDMWTKSKVESNQGYLTTSFSSDPIFRSGDEVVAPGR